MNHASEHDDLHTAFDHQVAGLAIGPSPIAAVMRDGAVLRARRRATLVSGVATLAVLPVAAFAVFGAGAGGTDGTGPDGSRGSTSSLQSAAQPGDSATTGSAPSSASSPKPTGNPGAASSPGTLKTLLTPDVTVPAIITSQSYAPDPHDAIKVLASGTYGGQHWRVVRDRFIVGPGQGEFVGSAGSVHLPLSQEGKNGNETCDFTGMQWGDRPPGTGPEYNGGGGRCGADKDVTASTDLIEMTDMTISFNSTVAVISGCVRSPEVASLTVTLDDRVSAPVPVSPVSGEPIACFAVFLDPRVGNSGQSVVLTAYDSQGHAVEHRQMNHGAKQ